MNKFMKRVAIFSVIFLLISFSACGGKDIDEKTGGQDNVPSNTDFSEPTDDRENSGHTGGEGETAGKTEGDEGAEITGSPASGENEPVKEPADTDEPESTKESIIPGGITRITREEAGLTTIPSLDFSGYKLNGTIQRLLENPTSYSDEDYQKGLVYDNFLVVSERFREDIIRNIGIGDGISEVFEILGLPSCIIGDTMFYKTGEYYLGFKGEKTVEQAVLSPKPGVYPSDILKIIAICINRPDYYGITTLLDENSEISEFFEYNGHIHGGGWYAFSNNGVYYEEYNKNAVVVYNNFEGELYKLQEDLYNYRIVYKDVDFLMERMVSELDGYIGLNKAFEEEGIVSPGGKYNSLYVWNYSESYYFIIRTMDASSTDKYVSLAATGEYYWLSDRYILYTDFFTLAPVLFDVETYETINLLDMTELIYDDFGYYSIEIKSHEDGKIIIYYSDGDKEYRINYSFDPDGKIILEEDL